MKKCKDCHIFCQQSDNGGICGMSNFGTVGLDDGCRVGDIFDSIYEHGYNKALDDFVNAYYKYCETQYGRLADDEMVDMAKVKEKLRK